MFLNECDDGTEKWGFDGVYPEPETIVKVFSWAQWDCVNQVTVFLLLYILVQVFLCIGPYWFTQLNISQRFTKIFNHWCYQESNSGLNHRAPTVCHNSNLDIIARIAHVLYGTRVCPLLNKQLLLKGSLN